MEGHRSKNIWPEKKMDSIGEKAVDIHVGDSEIGVFGSGWGMNITKIYRRTKFIK